MKTGIAVQTVLVSILMVFVNTLHAQHDHRTRRCATGEALEKYFNKYPVKKAQFEERQLQFDRRVATALRDRSNNPSASRLDAIATIPVVVHVVLPNPQVLTDAQIQRQIDVLNIDYAGLNSDSSKIPEAFKPRFGKSNIRFCLAQRNEVGEPTSGIVRVSSNVISQVGEGDPIKYEPEGSGAWDPERYLNIWVGNLANNNLGYTYLPLAGIPDAEIGIVILYTAFGTKGTALAPYDLGRTATHEVGHFFNLRHIWGGNDCRNDCTDEDGVNDTPLQNTCFSGTPSFPTTDNCSPNFPGVMFMNYMDYVNDNSMYLFTTQQVERMELALTTLSDRTPLLNSNGCVPPVVAGLDVRLKSIVDPSSSGIYCESTLTPRVVVRNTGSTPISSVRITVQIDDGASLSFNQTVSINAFEESTITLASISNISPGSHIVTVYTSLPNQQADQNTSNDTLSDRFFITRTIDPPIVESFEGNVFPPADWATGTNSDSSNFIWQRTTAAAHTGQASTFYNNFEFDDLNKLADLRMPRIQYNNVDSVVLSFQVAAAQYDSRTADTLQVLVSRDCGSSFTSVYKKWGNSLRTRTSFTTESFVPAASEWRQERIDLTAAASNTGELLVVFRNIGQWGNNIYLDDINLYTRTLPQRLKEQGYLIAPNPFSSNFSIQSFPDAEGLKDAAVYTTTGQQVWRRTFGAGNAPTLIPVSLGNLSPGIYIVRVTYTNRVVTQKIFKGY